MQEDYYSGTTDIPLELIPKKPGNPLTTWIRIPGLHTLEEALKTFSPFERGLLYLFAIILAGATIFQLINLNSALTVEVPARGGSFTEGVVGTPRFINPLLAISDTDRDFTGLVYSGLLRAAPDGSFLPDLAASYTISDDGLAYTFTIRDDAYFHNGDPVTATDVAFTISSAQSPEIKSPKRADWEGVDVEAISTKEVRFTLPRPYAPFLENTTIGILPEKLWGAIAPEEFPFHALNTNPIGSGPYKVDAIRTDDAGTPQRYTLDVYDNFTLGPPHLREVTFRFYPNEDELTTALLSGEIESAAGLSPETMVEIDEEELRVFNATLPRVFAVFINQNQAPILADADVRRALDVALDKEAIINEVLGGYGQALDSPIPPGVLEARTILRHQGTSTPEEEREEILEEAALPSRIFQARDILEAAGWELDEERGVWEDDDTTLTLRLATADTPELVETAELIADTWREVGVEISVEIFSTSDLNTSVIRPREYQMLLFGEIVGRSLDLFAFWHSSQRIDPGLNLSLYTNTNADSLLSAARVETNREEREKTYLEFADIVREDIPAFFLYAPDFLYVVPRDIEGIELGALTAPAERFLNIYNWHTETEQVWNIFTNS